MIKPTLDFIGFLSSNFSFLFALILYTLLAVALAKSIKKDAKIYYWVFAIISFAFLIPFVLRICGVTLPFNLGDVPFLGLAMNELSHAAYFIHPVLVIIMYMGALSPKINSVGRLMSIRKELSIIVGFPVLAHSIKRVLVSFPDGWKFFFDNDAYMQNPRVTSALGSGIMSFAFVLGLFMTILFLILWITSFDSVRRKMGSQKWKSVQKWSYGLYAMLFIHSLCLQVGGLVNDKAKEQKMAQTEVVKNSQEGHSQHQHESQQAHNHSAPTQQQVQHGAAPQQQAQAAPAQGGRRKPFSFESVEIPRATKRAINIFALIAIYGSYLYLRLKKAKADRAKRTNK